ncbi:MAG: disulfide bond formation protein B, partial [Gammaproteobacteria bacterium]
MSSRVVFLAICLACTGLMGFGLYLQHAQGLEPCPLCILQRYAFVATGLVALIAALHGPGRLGSALYGLLVVLATGAGG